MGYTHAMADGGHVRTVHAGPAGLTALLWEVCACEGGLLNKRCQPSRLTELHVWMHGRVCAECLQEERAHAEAHSSLANDAVATLRCPLRRSRHLLQLTTGTGGEEEADAGAGAGRASATITDASLLMRVMEAREAVEEAADAGDAGQLRRLAAANAADRAQCEVPKAGSSTAAPSDCPAGAFHHLAWPHTASVTSFGPMG
jgi:hypothetical protein